MSRTGYERKWITREEIAQIVDARRTKIVNAIAKDRMTVLQEMEVGSQVLLLESQAATIRAADRLFSHKIGDRVA